MSFKDKMKKFGQKFVNKAFSKEEETVQYLRTTFGHSFTGLEGRIENRVDSVSPHTADNINADMWRSTLFLGSGTKGNIYNGSSKFDIFYGNAGINQLEGKGSGDLYLIDRKSSGAEIKESRLHKGTDSILFSSDITRDDLTFEKVSDSHLRITVAASSPSAADSAVYNLICTNEAGIAGTGKDNASWYGIETINFLKRDKSVDFSLSWSDIDKLLLEPKPPVVEDDPLENMFGSQASNLTQSLAVESSSAGSTSATQLTDQSVANAFSLAPSV